MAICLIDYQIAQLKKQIAKLEMKKCKLNQPPAISRKSEYSHEFIICDEQENFCVGSKDLLSKHLCPKECLVYFN